MVQKHQGEREREREREGERERKTGLIRLCVKCSNTSAEQIIKNPMHSLA